MVFLSEIDLPDGSCGFRIIAAYVADRCTLFFREVHGKSRSLPASGGSDGYQSREHFRQLLVFTDSVLDTVDVVLRNLDVLGHRRLHRQQRTDACPRLVTSPLSRFQEFTDELVLAIYQKREIPGGHRRYRKDPRRDMRTEIGIQSTFQE